MLIDTHAHLDFPEFSEDLKGVLERANEAGVKKVVTIGISLTSSRKAVELANTHPEIHATVGIHPHGASSLTDQQLETLENLARSKRVLAIGEVGLDYYRDRQPRDIQQECLRQQLGLACKIELPVVFHIREAHGDFFTVIKDYVPALKGVVLHCFSGDWTVAKRCLDMGFYLSIPGTVTFPKAEIQQKVVRLAPLDRLLLETDAPYLAPVPFRGKVNEPAFVLYTAQKVANLRRCSLEEVAHQTTTNAHNIFGIESLTQ
jgi:TatD DNase family protein